MDDIVEFLNHNEIHYLAGVGLDGKPKVRPFQFMFEEDGKLWFCTSNQKEIFKELQIQLYIELCAQRNNMSWLRLQGEANFSDKVEIKAKVLECSSLVNSIYKNPENPDFEVFFLSEVTASISEIGKTPIYFSF